MSVLVVVSHENTATALTRWGHRFARADNTNLVVLYCTKVGNTHAPPTMVSSPADDPDPAIQGIYHATMALRNCSAELAKNEPDIAIKKLVSADPLEAIHSEIDALDTDTLILCKERSSREGADESALARNLFRASTCKTILMRLGASNAEKCASILIPTAGGPHALSALQTAASITAHEDGNVVALYVNQRATR